MATFGERFKKLRLETDLNQEELANDFNSKYMYKFGKATISMYEGNKRRPEITALQHWADYFNVTVDYLLGLSDERTSDPDKVQSNIYNEIHDAVRIPVLGRISAGLPIMATEHIEGYEFVSRALLLPRYDYFYLRVEGDSMNIKFQNGNLVLVQRQDCIENGDIAIVMVNGYDAVVKKFAQQANLITLIPMSTNPIHLPQIYDTTKTEIRIIGKVTYFMGKV